jgi:hypothetical protein
MERQCKTASSTGSLWWTMLTKFFWVTLLLLVISVPSVSADPKTSPALTSAGFLSYHPDIRWRNEAIEHYDREEYEDAIRDLIRSAKYADKGSQGLLAEMHWKGLGTPPNRPLAYAWMDLAAEGGYSEFVVLRERYWSDLSEHEKAEALRVGKDIYAVYGDDVAKPRLAKLLNKARRSITGSRTGYRGPLQITIRMPGGGFYTLNGEEYYADEYWKPEIYFEWKKQVWVEAQKGRVEVGPLESAD